MVGFRFAHPTLATHPTLAHCFLPLSRQSFYNEKLFFHQRHEKNHTMNTVNILKNRAPSNLPHLMQNPKMQWAFEIYLERHPEVLIEVNKIAHESETRETASPLQETPGAVRRKATALLQQMGDDDLEWTDEVLKGIKNPYNPTHTFEE